MVDQFKMSKMSNSGRRGNAIDKSQAANRAAARRVVPLVIVLGTFATFLPTLSNGFLNWDDEAILLANPEYRGLGWSHLKWMFTTFHHSLYRPLTWITWGIDYLIWGTNPFGYHLTSLIFHCANAAAFYFVAMRLLRLSMPDLTEAEYPVRVSAGIAALLFSVHPLRVEPVAWASGRENVVSALFFILTILFYLKAVEPSRNRLHYRGWMAFALAVFGMSLMSKAAGMMLPFALLILDVYPLRRLQTNPRHWLRPDGLTIWCEKIPFVLFGIAAGAIGWWAKYQVGGMTAWQDYGFVPRAAQSIYGLAFYLWKTLFPLDLSPLYELPQEIMQWRWTIAGCGIILGLVTTGLLLLRNRYPAALTSWLYYIIIASPVLGISQSGPQIAADRYTYLACLGWALLAGGGWYYLRQASRTTVFSPRYFSLVNVAGVAVLICLAVLTWQQTKVWVDSETLWRHAISIRPSTIGHYHLGLTFDRKGMSGAAIREYRRSLEIRPQNFEARYALAGALFRAGDFAEATRHYRLALEMAPSHSNLHVDLANMLIAQNRVREAMQHYEAAIRSDPANGNAYFNLGNAFARLRQPDKAIENYHQAVRVRRSHSEAHFSLANALVMQGNLAAAIDHYQQAIKYKPDFAEAYHNLGRTLAAQGRLVEAIEQFLQAVRTRADFAEAHASLSQALMEAGRKDEAMRHYREANRLHQLNRGSFRSPSEPNQ
jgi:tetratricopeptide (TPR) repeat protein